MCVQFQIVFVGLSEVSDTGQCQQAVAQTECNRLYHDITPPAPHTDPPQSLRQMSPSGGGIPVR